MIEFSFSTHNSPDTIYKKRKIILDTLTKADPGFAANPVQSIKRVTLEQMLSLYDSLFLNDCLSTYYKKLDVTLSPRLLKSAGKFVHYTSGAKARNAEIRMSSDFLFRLKGGPFELNGLKVNTPQEAFLVVFEHELCHAVENAIYGSTGHSNRFLYFAYGVFGHTKTTHNLPTVSSETTDKTGIRVGSTVTFPYEGRILTGYVSYLGKTARVMVMSPNGNYVDKNHPGRRYLKYQVPLDLLTLKR